MEVRTIGRRVQAARCHDCPEPSDEEGEYGDIGELDSNQFWIKMEWMDKQELIEHIEDTVCPDCGSDNWELTDRSTI